MESKELTQQLRAVAHMLTVKQEEEAYQYLNLLITQLEAGRDYCDSCGQVAWLCICEPIEAKEEQRSNYCNSCGSWCCVSCKLTPKLHATSCEDCESAATVKLERYGSSFQAVIVCPKCGVSYDTNLDEADIEALR